MNVSPITYVPAVSEQADFLTQFAMDSNNVYGYRSVPDDEARKVFLIKKEDFSNDIIMIMKIAEEVIGFYSLRIRPNSRQESVKELGHLFLKPGYIRQGYGTVLFKKAMEHAKQIGWNELEWESDPFAAEFYQKMGAKQIGENPCPLNPNYKSPVFRYSLK